MITKTLMTILRSASITILFLMTKPQTLSGLVFGIIVFSCAMFLDYELFFNKLSQSCSKQKKENKNGN